MLFRLGKEFDIDFEFVPRQLFFSFLHLEIRKVILSTTNKDIIFSFLQLTFASNATFLAKFLMVKVNVQKNILCVRIL